MAGYQLPNFLQVFSVNPGFNIRESVHLSMSSIPKFKPATILASIVLIFNAKTPPTSGKFLLRPLHHVCVVLGLLVVKEGDGGERGRKRFSDDTLWGMSTYIRTLFYGWQTEKISAK